MAGRSGARGVRDVLRDKEGVSVPVSGRGSMWRGRMVVEYTVRPKQCPPTPGCEISSWCPQNSQGRSLSRPTCAL